MKIVKFEKDGCVPCQMVQNVLDENDVNVEKVNPFDYPELAVKYDISSVPVTILFDGSGNEVMRSIGFKPDELEEMVNLLK